MAGIFGALFGGSGGTSTTQQSNQTSSTNYPDWYNQYTQGILGRGQDLAYNTAPFTYDISKMYAPFQPAQTQAFNQVQGNQGAYQPFYNAASGALNNSSGLDPMAAAGPYMAASMGLPTGYGAGAGYLANSAMGFGPQQAAQYMNPFAAGALQYGNQLASNQFFENTLPRVNEDFIKSGGGLGRNRNQEFIGRATRDFGNAMLGQDITGMSSNYWQGANQFNTDMSRRQGAGTALGGLANSTLGALTGAGQAAAGITTGAINSGLGIANAYSNLGGALSNTNLTNTNALLQVGNQQQQQAQNPLTAAYQQAQSVYQDPFAKLNWLRGISQGLSIPTTTNTQSTQTASSTGSSSPSPVGALTGLASSILSIPGVSNYVGSLFGPGATSQGPGGGNASGFPAGGGPQGPSGGAIYPQQRGGLIPRRRRYAAGGNVAIVKGMLSNPGPSMRAMMGRQGRPPNMNPMGPLSGPMATPPPMMGGALRGATMRSNA